MYESRSHNDGSVDELLISSLSVQRVLESKRRTPIGPREFSQVRTSGRNASRRHFEIPSSANATEEN